MREQHFKNNSLVTNTQFQWKPTRILDQRESTVPFSLCHSEQTGSIKLWGSTIQQFSSNWATLKLHREGRSQTLNQNNPKNVISYFVNKMPIDLKRMFRSQLPFPNSPSILFFPHFLNWGISSSRLIVVVNLIYHALHPIQTISTTCAAKTAPCSDCVKSPKTCRRLTKLGHLQPSPSPISLAE